ESSSRSRGAAHVPGGRSTYSQGVIGSRIDVGATTAAWLTSCAAMRRCRSRCDREHFARGEFQGDLLVDHLKAERSRFSGTLDLRPPSSMVGYPRQARSSADKRAPLPHPRLSRPDAPASTIKQCSNSNWPV